MVCAEYKDHILILHLFLINCTVGQHRSVNVLYVYTPMGYRRRNLYFQRDKSLGGKKNLPNNNNCQILQKFGLKKARRIQLL